MNSHGSDFVFDLLLHVFTMRLHVMQRTILPRPFCPSVCLSVKRVLCEKTKETCAYILIPHERSFSLVF